MADIELVIKIPEGLKKDFETEQWTALSCMEIKNALEKATLLPKGHDRLIYAQDVGEYLTLADVPTIIEADAPKKRKGTPLEENDSGYNCENWIP